MTRAGALVLVLSASLVPGCASTPHNYLDPQAPLHEGGELLLAVSVGLGRRC